MKLLRPRTVQTSSRRCQPIQLFVMTNQLHNMKGRLKKSRSLQGHGKFSQLIQTWENKGKTIWDVRELGSEQLITRNQIR